MAETTQITVQFPAPWGLDRIVPPMDLRYRYKYTGTGVRVFILDTGIRLTHGEFGGRATCGFTAYPPNCDDVRGHGTHVAGIVGGRTYGVAKNVSLVAVKVLGNSGTGPWSGIIAGINYVMLQKATSTSGGPMVINMSLGGSLNILVNTAVQNAYTAGIVVAVSAGNKNANACAYSPASAPNAITVASARRKWFFFWWFYQDAKASTSNHGNCVDIFAPGVSIRSSWWTSDVATAVLSGTSMASPFVAGVAALHLQKTPASTPASVWTAILADAFLGVLCPWWPWLPAGTPNRLLGKASLLI
jgi:aqualysin 1